MGHLLFFFLTAKEYFGGCFIIISLILTSQKHSVPFGVASLVDFLYRKWIFERKKTAGKRHFGVVT